MLGAAFVRSDAVEAPAAATRGWGGGWPARWPPPGHDVTVLELWDGRTPPPAVPGCAQQALAFAGEAAMEKALEGGAAGGSPLPLRLLRLAAHPAAVEAAVRQFVLRRPRRVTGTRRAIERLDAETPFDAVCAVAAPYRAAFALEGADIRGKKLLWQMDPYAANETYAAPAATTANANCWAQWTACTSHSRRRLILPRRAAGRAGPARAGARVPEPGPARRNRERGPTAKLCVLRHAVPEAARTGRAAGAVRRVGRRVDADHGGRRLGRVRPCARAGRGRPGPAAADPGPGTARARRGAGSAGRGAGEHWQRGRQPGAEQTV